MTKETSASGSAAVGASSPFATPSVEKLLRIERRNIGRELGQRQRKIAGHAHEGARANQFAIADARDDRYPHDLARDARFADAREPVGLVDSAQASGDAAERSAQTHLDAFRRGGKIGFAVERSKNGASHQGGAAQARQDRAAEPLHGKPAPADQAAGAAVDRKRRLVAEIEARPRTADLRRAALPWSKTAVPCTRDRPLAFRRQSRLPSGQSHCRCAGHFAQRRQCPHQSNQGDWTVEIKALCLVALPRHAHPRRELCKNGGGMWPQCGARTGFNGRICGGLESSARGLECSAKRPTYRLVTIHSTYFDCRAVDNGREPKPI